MTTLADEHLTMLDDKLPPIPKARKKRREQRPNGCYELVPAYTEAELKAYAHEAIAKALSEQKGAEQC